ncbi:viperin family antiviral radical SAM protein [Acinetobacter sp. ANC 4862]|uniref:viperin family antiviral radical SAM protein n=1 Tax=Acinetobacter sp. ANC 4862 TaxID=2529849 RepID=UPI00103D6208|nr:viperin family antiviral radical SAM protein [Acinetobacter sp. ANC 4862]TCH63252.1 radical SAM protein [Acinetobacter sp. ANC 4862]
MTNLVVNWHITEACNYQCFYCFAKWKKNENRELIHDNEKVLKLVKEVSLLPMIINQVHGTNFTGIRLNLVGGETFLYKQKILGIIKEAKKYHFELSAITNGTVLDDELIKIIGNEFLSIGFSVDSLNKNTNKEIGRTVKNMPMDADEILKKINLLRTLSPNIEIKINTVINELNKLEDFNSFITKASPTKWKIFKMLPILTEENSINNDDFYNFINRHTKFKKIIYSENNDEMTHSYLMIDPLGRFFQNNELLHGYDYSQSILQIGVETAVKQIKFNIHKFAKRANLMPIISL